MLNSQDRKKINAEYIDKCKGSNRRSQDKIWYEGVKEYTEVEVDRIIEMVWEDRTPF